MWVTCLLDVSLLLVTVRISLCNAQSVCYEELGCVSVNASWYSIFRPVNRLPLARSVINTSFVLHTRELPTKNTYLNASVPSTISSSFYRASRPTKFIVHGFLDFGNETQFLTMSHNFLIHGDYNVIIVEWGGGAGTPYTQAVGNARLVGLEIAFLIRTLVNQFAARTADFHLVGHSLGAHVAGYAGKTVANLGRITGLDPAGPLFEWTPAFVGLDPGDASFVDVIHTNGVASLIFIGFGEIQPLGHLDVYLNGGKRQPGCQYTVDRITLSLIRRWAFMSTCSHSRAIAVFSDSLVSTCRQVAYECSSYSDFEQGKCATCGADNLYCAPMGIDADLYPSRSRTNVRLFMDTLGTAPFCAYHYRVKLELADPPVARIWVTGHLTVSIMGTGGQITKELTNSTRITHGQTLRFLVVDKVNVGQVRTVVVSWDYQSSLLDPTSFCGSSCNRNLYVNSVEVASLTNYPQSSILANTFQLCPSSNQYTAIASGSSFPFSSNCA